MKTQISYGLDCGLLLCFSAELICFETYFCEKKKKDYKFFLVFICDFTNTFCVRMRPDKLIIRSQIRCLAMFLPLNDRQSTRKVTIFVNL